MEGIGPEPKRQRLEYNGSRVLPPQPPPPPQSHSHSNSTSSPPHSYPPQQQTPPPPASLHEVAPHDQRSLPNPTPPAYVQEHSSHSIPMRPPPQQHQYPADPGGHIPYASHDPPPNGSIHHDQAHGFPQPYFEYTYLTAGPNSCGSVGYGVSYSQAGTRPLKKGNRATQVHYIRDHARKQLTELAGLRRLSYEESKMR